MADMAEMAEREAVAPVRRTVTVRCSQDHAFRVFTERMGSWWPLDQYSRAVDQGADVGITAVDVRVEGREGGAIVELTSDGAELSWGEVLAWEPPDRVVYAWKPYGRPTPPTELEVTFTAAGDGTRVDLDGPRGRTRPGRAPGAAVIARQTGSGSVGVGRVAPTFVPGAANRGTIRPRCYIPTISPPMPGVTCTWSNMRRGASPRLICAGSCWGGRASRRMAASMILSLSAAALLGLLRQSPPHGWD